MPNSPNEEQNAPSIASPDPGLGKLLHRLAQGLNRDQLVQDTTDDLRHLLNIDRVVLYYFYSHWKGQVTFESLSRSAQSIYGSTGPDECFNGDYAAMYEAGRVRAIPDIEIEPMAPCHRDMLRQMQVRANLVVPIRTAEKGLWGLLVAHHGQVRSWSAADVAEMQHRAATLALAPAIAHAVF